jgi:phosphohistidine phosphatase
MQLYVVRHGVAEYRDATRWPDDRARPLTPEGVERFRRAARGLSKLGPPPDKVFSSGLTRAWQTAEILHEEAAWPAPQEMPELEPEVPPEKISEALQSHADTERLAVVGHEPNLSELISLLIAGSAEAVDIDLKKGAVVCVDAGPFPLAGEAAILWSVPPRALRAL